MSASKRIAVQPIAAHSLATASPIASQRTSSFADEAEQPIFDANVVPATFQDGVDHFSNDARAMSPRGWSDLGAEPTAPQLTFDSGVPTENVAPQRSSVEPDLFPPDSPMQQVESSRLREPEPFFEQDSLDPDRESTDSSELSSPLPMEFGPDEQIEASESRIEQSDEIIPKPTKLDPALLTPDSATAPTFHDHAEPIQGPYRTEIIEAPFFPGDSQLVHGHDGACVENQSCGCRNCHRKRRRINQQELQTPICVCGQPTCSHCMPAKYNAKLGHRYEQPISRGSIDSSTSKFSFEEDEDFPPISEILAQSVFWSEFEYLFIQPSFQGNTAIQTLGPAGSASQAFNFDLESAFRVSVGFESDFGPGFAVDYFQFDNDSDVVNFTSDGAVTGTTSILQDNPSALSSLTASNPGDSLNALHSLEVHSTSVYAFKAIQFKRAYVNGRFGIQITSVEQILRADLADASGASIGRLNQLSNIDAFGPRFGIDYVRKIGHTPAQLIAKATTSLLFGDRDEFVENTLTGDVTRVGADEFLSVFDIFFGVQGKRIRGEKRNTTFRVGFVNQTWFGGGTGIDPDGDFGFQGLSLMLGFNR